VKIAQKTSSNTNTARKKQAYKKLNKHLPFLSALSQLKLSV